MGKHQIVNASKEVDYRNAEKTLILYLKKQDMSITHCQEWARWTYGNIPFWSVWGIVCGNKNYSIGLCGIHIYDDGRVLIVSNSERIE